MSTSIVTNQLPTLPTKEAPLRILVESPRVFAILNYLRDFVMDASSETYKGVHRVIDPVYLEEANNAQVQQSYVLTEEEVLGMSEFMFGHRLLLPEEN
jgi:hypothetical protein